MLKAVAMFDEDVQRPGDPDPVHQIKHFEPHFSMGCSISTRPMLALAMAAHPNHLQEVIRNWRRMAIYYVQNMSGQGRVRNLPGFRDPLVTRSEEHTSELPSLMRISYAVFCLQKKKQTK